MGQKALLGDAPGDRFISEVLCLATSWQDDPRSTPLSFSALSLRTSY